MCTGMLNCCGIRNCKQNPQNKANKAPRICLVTRKLNFSYYIDQLLFEISNNWSQFLSTQLKSALMISLELESTGSVFGIDRISNADQYLGLMQSQILT